MARGWESKNIEAQQAEAADNSFKGRKALTPEEAARSRQRDVLRLAQRRVFQQLQATQDPRHAQLLRDSLRDLEDKLKQLEP